MAKKLNVLGVFFNEADVGGINTVILGLKDGFKKAGHNFDYLHVTPNGKLRNLDKTRIHGKRYVRLSGEQFGYKNPIDVYKYRKMVSENYDFVIFLNSCPHFTKHSGGDDRTWQRLYKVDKPVFVIFHDNMWDRYYEWLVEVKDYIDASFYTVTNASKESLINFPGNHTFMPIPLSTDKANLYKVKKDNIIWLPQWKRWKGIVPFIKQVDKIKYDVDMYNIGLYYYNIKKDMSDLWHKAVNKDYYDDVVHNKKSKMTNYSLVLPEVVQHVLRSAGASIDISGSAGSAMVKAQTTCAMIEPMLYGTVSIVYKDIIEDPRSLLYQRDDLVYPVNSAESIARDVNALMGDKKLRRKLAKNAFEYAMKYNNSKDIVEKIIVPKYMEVVEGKLKRPKHNKAAFDEDYISKLESTEEVVVKKAKKEKKRYPIYLRAFPKRSNVVVKDRGQ